MTDYITRLATLVDKETKQILEDSLDLIKQIKYMVGIAERGTGKKCPDGERPEAFLLAYVKSLEAALAQQDAQDEIVAAWKSGMTVQYFVTIGYDDEWTDYTNPTPPDTSGTRLAWRVKPGQRSNAAPTPPAQKPLGWLAREAVECLQGAEMTWMPVWNRQCSSDPVPIFLGPSGVRWNEKLAIIFGEDHGKDC